MELDVMKSTLEWLFAMFATKAKEFVPSKNQIYDAKGNTVVNSTASLQLKLAVKHLESFQLTRRFLVNRVNAPEKP